MKIVSWNANCKFRDKLNIIDTYGWDVLIVQECENPNTSKDSEYKKWATNFKWVGDLEYKGLGLFLPENINAEIIGINPHSNKHFITVQLPNGMQILAVWAHAGSKRSVGYIYQLWEYLKANEKTLDWENLVIIGDWNSNAQWDKKRKVGNHSDVCNFLNSKGLVSSYHSDDKISQGSELDHTFFMHRNLNKGYHIDYLFAAPKFLSHSQKMKIGDRIQWLKYSDHLPISYQLNID
jgi:exonuclease III